MTSVVSKIGISSTSTGAATIESDVGSARRLVAGAQRERGEAEAEQQAAAVAHEDRRRVEVVDEEAAGRAEQQREILRLGKRRVPAAPGSSSISSAAPTISAMPAHRPSMLSSRLNALVRPTIQTSVSRLSSVTDSSQFSR